LDLGEGLNLEVFHTPGHSKGSCSFWFNKDRALFSGDTILLPNDLPIYEDVLVLVKSIKKLKAIKGIDILLSSWDEPRRGEQVYQVMEESLNYLQHIHETVIRVADKNVSLEPLELCKRVLEELGLPVAAANPLIARSFQANLKARGYL
jgi:hydroxyacylglutathione hydrolase